MHLWQCFCWVWTTNWNIIEVAIYKSQEKQFFFLFFDKRSTMSSHTIINVQQRCPALQTIISRRKGTCFFNIKITIPTIIMTRIVIAKTITIWFIYFFFKYRPARVSTWPQDYFGIFVLLLLVISYHKVISANIWAWSTYRSSSDIFAQVQVFLCTAWVFSESVASPCWTD